LVDLLFTISKQTNVKTLPIVKKLNNHPNA